MTKSRQQKQEIEFSSDYSESSNLLFSEVELTSSVRKAYDSATGPDSIYSANAEPDLKLYGACLPVVSEFKFLG